MQHAKLQHFPDLRERASALIVSEEVGVMKPHPEIFAHATRAAGTPAASIPYVGDSFHSDVEGGLKAGWQVTWFTSDDAAEDTAQAFCFSEWPALLSRLGLE